MHVKYITIRTTATFENTYITEEKKTIITIITANNQPSAC